MKTDSWANREENMRCRTCIWFVVKQGRVGRCRRHSPAPDGWPVVVADDWCGDHRIDEARVSAGSSGPTGASTPARLNPLPKVDP